MGDDLFTDVAGRPLPAQWFGAADVSIVPGSERRWPQSHSAAVNVKYEGGESSQVLFLKKVFARSMQEKPLPALRKDLSSNRVEARFYRDFAPVLESRGVPLLTALKMEENLDEALADPDDECRVRSGGLILLLPSAPGYQTSPLSSEQAHSTLQWLARFHAAAWEDAALLGRAAEQLHEVGGTWALRHRGTADLRKMTAVWPKFLEGFDRLAPELLAKPDIRQLAVRLERVATRLGGELSVGPAAPFATLLHGDFKAANIFLPEGEEGSGPIAIDFQWVGLGFGMADVAMHLIHSVAPEALQDGGDEQLVQAYLSELRRLLPAPKAEAYTDAVAWHHYRMGVLDYARNLFVGFVTDPASVKAKNEHPRAINIGMVYRDTRAPLHLVARVDEYLGMVFPETASCSKRDFCCML